MLKETIANEWTIGTFEDIRDDKGTSSCDFSFIWLHPHKRLRWSCWTFKCDAEACGSSGDCVEASTLTSVLFISAEYLEQIVYE